jgi:hypothetical protein
MLKDSSSTLQDMTYTTPYLEKGRDDDESTEPTLSIAAHAGRRPTPKWRARGVALRIPRRVGDVLPYGLW